MPEGFQREGLEQDCQLLVAGCDLGGDGVVVGAVVNVPGQGVPQNRGQRPFLQYPRLRHGQRAPVVPVKAVAQGKQARRAGGGEQGAAEGIGADAGHFSHGIGGGCGVAQRAGIENRIQRAAHGGQLLRIQPANDPVVGQ